mmetsp:Transcript_2927/g.7378  ORF Transcript_2927/g.7378 Transcript_2927/m.7378 type:complete len:329 (+) Transcript_2927:950-1936(+)
MTTEDMRQTTANMFASNDCVVRCSTPWKPSVSTTYTATARLPSPSPTSIIVGVSEIQTPEVFEKRSPPTSKDAGCAKHRPISADLPVRVGPTTETIQKGRGALRRIAAPSGVNSRCVRVLRKSCTPRVGSRRSSPAAPDSSRHPASRSESRALPGVRARRRLSAIVDPPLRQCCQGVNRRRGSSEVQVEASGEQERELSDCGAKELLDSPRAYASESGARDARRDGTLRPDRDGAGGFGQVDLLRAAGGAHAGDRPLRAGGQPGPGRRQFQLRRLGRCAGADRAGGRDGGDGARAQRRAHLLHGVPHRQHRLAYRRTRAAGQRGVRDL